MDGAMGTELQRAGLSEDDSGVGWSLTHPERVRSIHAEYVQAGAEVLLTNTFQANRSALQKWGLELRLEAIARAAVTLARSAAGNGRWVLGDVGPLAETEAGHALPVLLDVFRESDGILLETFSDCRILAVAMEWVGQHGSSLPVLFSATYRKKGTAIETAKGLSPQEVARQAEKLGTAALGVNCGLEIGMKDVCAILKEYRRATDLPLFARPNAGTPVRRAEGWHYPRTAEEMAGKLPELLDAGAHMVGGCCGTTPRHIEEFRKAIDQRRAIVKD
jgi:methionine synthase I (cobalamin-dependent)